MTWTAGPPLGPIVQIRSRQEVRANHLQTVSSRLIRTQHQSCCLDCLFDDRNLALVQFEVDNLPRFRFPPRQFRLHAHGFHAGEALPEGKKTKADGLVGVFKQMRWA